MVDFRKLNSENTFLLSGYMGFSQNAKNQFQKMLPGYLPLKTKIIKRSEFYCEFNEKGVV